MATLTSNYLTLADFARRLDPDGKPALIAEMLSQENEILEDLIFQEANGPTGHQSTIRTGLPSLTWRLLNTGVPPSKSTTAQVIDTFGSLTGYSVIDKKEAQLSGDVGKFRLMEDVAFMEAMAQTVASTIFYGNSAANPQQFLGLAPRFSTVSTATAQNAVNVLDAGGTGSVNTSIWLVGWGPRTVFGIFPKGSKAGLTHIDHGDTRYWADASGNPYENYQSYFEWDIGLVVKDWRYVVRIANIDTTLLSGGSAANLINLLNKAVYRPPTTPKGVAAVQKTDAVDEEVPTVKWAFYCNRTIRQYLDIQAQNKANVLLRLSEWEGKVITDYRGIPFRTCDGITNAEARVV